VVLTKRASTTCRTYHTLISPGKGKTRLEQVIEWVGGPDFDGAIVFDEAHKVCGCLPV
jgi:P-loop containing NTP hydrolase pore-1